MVVSGRDMASCTSKIINDVSLPEPAAPNAKLRISTSPVPFEPPVGLVLLVSAPAGTVIKFNVLAVNDAIVFKASRSSVKLKLKISTLLVLVI